MAELIGTITIPLVAKMRPQSLDWPIGLAIETDVSILFAGAFTLATNATNSNGGRYP